MIRWGPAGTWLLLGLREFYESDEAQALAAPPNAAELLKLVDTVIRFTRAGTDGTQ